jgi:heme/copper-type cytochrome/quinol oxidase subunit 1
MDFDWLKTSGAIAGIGGIAVASVAFVFREVIRKEMFPRLTKVQAYKLLNRMITLIFIIGVLGLIAYGIVSFRTKSNNSQQPQTTLSPTPAAPNQNQNGQSLQESVDTKPTGNNNRNRNTPGTQNNFSSASPRTTPRPSGVIQQRLDRPSNTNSND